MNILLDYFFPISSIEATPEASTAFLKQICVVAKPKSGQEGNVGTIYSCVNMTQVGVRTDNTNAQQLFNAGMSKVFVLLASDLDLATALEDSGSDFYTLLISDDFSDADIAQAVDTPAVAASKQIGNLLFTAVHAGVTGNDITITLLDDTTEGNELAHAVGNDITIHMAGQTSTAQEIADAFNESVSCTLLATVAVDSGQGATSQFDAVQTNLEDGAAAVFDTGTGVQVGTWAGVIGVSSEDSDVCADQAALSQRACFFANSDNKAKNLFYAFGKLLSNALNWRNQQYITMPFDDDVNTLGEANSLFDDKVDFVITDDEFGSRLALFAAGGKAIVAPYIKRNLQIDLQSAALSYISGNQPAFTKTQAALLEDSLQKVVQSYIDRQWIEAGTVQVSLIEDNFVASGEINIAEPKALWRIFGEMRASL